MTLVSSFWFASHVSPFGPADVSAPARRLPVDYSFFAISAVFSWELTEGAGDC